MGQFATGSSGDDETSEGAWGLELEELIEEVGGWTPLEKGRKI